MNRELVIKIRLIVISLMTYFALDFPIRILNLSYFKPCFGLKSFLVIPFGLLLGVYGIIGEVVAIILSSFVLKVDLNYFFIEMFFVVFSGLFTWFFWYAFSKKPILSFKRVFSYIKFILLISISFFISSFVSTYVFKYENFHELFLWYFILTMIVGLPVLILYRGIFCIRPIIPSMNIRGEKLKLTNDLVVTLTKDSNSISIFNETFEDYAMLKHLGMKKVFEIQNLIEELYIRIINHYDDVKISLLVNYDVTFSIEFTYVGEKYNPLLLLKTEDDIDAMGIKLIKHRAITASYDYLFNENYVHLVI